MDHANTKKIGASSESKLNDANQSLIDLCDSSDDEDCAKGESKSSVVNTTEMKKSNKDNSEICINNRKDDIESIRAAAKKKWEKQKLRTEATKNENNNMNDGNHDTGSRKYGASSINSRKKRLRKEVDEHDDEDVVIVLDDENSSDDYHLFKDRCDTNKQRRGSKNNLIAKQRGTYAIKSSTEQAGLPVRKFNIATYNIWFGPPHPEERMLALSKLLLEHNKVDNIETETTPLWFIGFQEVTLPLGEVLFPLLESAGYKVIVQDLKYGYGCALAVLQQLPGKHETRCPKIISTGWCPYRDTVMDRGFLFAQVQLPPTHPGDEQQQLLVASTHLESFVRNHNGRGDDYTGAEQRKLQIQQFDEFCTQKFSAHQHEHLNTAIIVGDMNWDDIPRKTKRSKPPLDSPLLDIINADKNSNNKWLDTWLERAHTYKKEEQLGYTYDSKVSPMLGGYLQRRFDRCIIRTNNTQKSGSLTKSISNKKLFGIEATALIGKDAIPNLSWKKTNPYNGQEKQVPVCPSDHFGYVVTLSIS